MMVSASNWPVANFLSTSVARMGEPQGTCKASASLAHRLETSNHLSEKAPHMQFNTFLATRFRRAPSITPQADEVLMKTNCLVESNCCSWGCIFAYKSLKPCPRCPIIGVQNARNVFSLTSTGPGMCNLTCRIRVDERVPHLRTERKGVLASAFGRGG